MWWCSSRIDAPSSGGDSPGSRVVWTAPAGFGSPGQRSRPGFSTDLDESVVREIGLSSGLVDNEVCAIDETWSGLRFVVRVADLK